MGRRAKESPESLGDRLRNGQSHPAATPEERENQMIALAYDLAEQQLRAGTASSQVIAHFLKIGTLKNQYELEKLKQETALLSAKKSAIEAEEDIKVLYADAIKAMQKYRGESDAEE